MPIIPGDEPITASWGIGDVLTSDGRLIDIDNNFIVDTSGNRILIGYGYADGNEPVGVSLTPGDSL